MKQSNISFIVNVKIHPVGSFDDASSCSAFAPFGSPRSVSQLISVVVENLLTRLLSRFQEIYFFAYFEFWYCQIYAIWRISWNTLSISSIRSANITSPGPYERSSGSILSGVFIYKSFPAKNNSPNEGQPTTLILQIKSQVSPITLYPIIFFNSLPEDDFHIFILFEN